MTHEQLLAIEEVFISLKNNNMPLYSIVRQALLQIILEGRLIANERLPASRTLAKRLSVSRDTIESAYESLESEGYIERFVGRGSYVANYFSRFDNQPVFPEVHHSVAENTGSGMSRRGAVLSQGYVNLFEKRSSYLLMQGIPDTNNFPSLLWSKLERQVINRVGNSIYLNNSAQGIPELRSEIANYINIHRGCRATPEQILIITSAQQGFMLCGNILFDHGDSIAIEEPSYLGARYAFKSMGIHCLPVNVDEKGIETASLEDNQCSTIKGVYVTPSHQFPTGVSLSLERRLELIHWAHKNNRWILEDDYDSEFHYEGAAYSSLQGLDPYGRTLYIGTFSKSLHPALRLAYLVLPPQLITSMTNAKQQMDGHNAIVPQYVLTEFIKLGHYHSYIHSMKKIYVTRRNELIKQLTNHLSEYVYFEAPKGGLQLTCIFKNNISESLFVAEARKQSIMIQALSSYYESSVAKSGFLIGFARHSPFELEFAIQQLAKIFKKLIAKT